ncbi:MAG TPA: TetR/AcrR family transcriptional regulator [Solirubrobacteraceae bacterium]|nr:TetR/AcrR family transcriptional regulator [Solirubrobacteraceae bacterium]
MESGRRTSSAARARGGEPSARTGEDPARVGPPRVAPLYKRLPHGPHRLARDEVVHNQRTRIHGAMIEAVASRGYRGTSVKRVIALAGVSRRSFYEHFANKQECFIATFDLIARRELQHVRRAYLAADGTLEDRVRASLRRFARMTLEERKAAVLVVLEAQTAGVPGVLRLRQATGACEHMLAQSFAQTAGAVALPTPIVRCIAGGLHGVASAFLRREPAGERPDVVEEMLGWTLLFQTPAAERMAESMAAALSVRVREIAAIYGHGRGGAEASSRDERTRVLQSILRLSTREDYATLSAPQIADEANVSIEAFCKLFAGRDECYLAALDMIGDELLAIAADPELVSEEWPQAVRSVLAELMRYLADHPLHARTLAQEGFFAGPAARERIDDLAHSIATLLIEGAPAQARSRLTAEAVAGAIWHTVRCQVGAGRIPLLVALSDYLAYVVLAPHLGADAAAEILTEERPPVSRVACETGVRQST